MKNTEYIDYNQQIKAIKDHIRSRLRYGYLLDQLVYEVRYDANGTTMTIELDNKDTIINVPIA